MTLNQLAGKLADSFLPASVRHRNLFINEIPADMPAEHNHEYLAAVISDMFAAVFNLNHVADSGVRLSAKQYGYIVVLELQQETPFGPHLKNFEWKRVQTMAEKIGGCLHINSGTVKTNTLSFSYPNLPLIS